MRTGWLTAGLVTKIASLLAFKLKALAQKQRANAAFHTYSAAQPPQNLGAIPV
jgi:hypothetical protein